MRILITGDSRIAATEKLVTWICAQAQGPFNLTAPNPVRERQ